MSETSFRKLTPLPSYSPANIYILLHSHAAAKKKKNFDERPVSQRASARLQKTAAELEGVRPFPLSFLLLIMWLDALSVQSLLFPSHRVYSSK